MKVAERKRILRSLGWRVDTEARYRQAIYDFRTMEPMRAGRKAGPLTQRRLARAEKRRKAGKPTLNKWFSHRDFQCKCGGRYASCRRIVAKRRLVVRTYKMRKKSGRPLVFRSAYRCPNHNAAVGGASLSQHKYGRAVDLDASLSYQRVKSFRLWTGIGVMRATGGVAHVDHRPKSGTVWNPVRWFYG